MDRDWGPDDTVGWEEIEVDDIIPKTKVTKKVVFGEVKEPVRVLVSDVQVFTKFTFLQSKDCLN